MLWKEKVCGVGVEPVYSHNKVERKEGYQGGPRSINIGGAGGTAPLGELLLGKEEDQEGPRSIHILRAGGTVPLG